MASLRRAGVGRCILFFSSRRRHTRCSRDWSSDVCSSDLLNTKGMLANHHLAQAVSDASFSEVKRQLLYKAEQYGGYVQLVSQWYPSSKTCHACGWVKQDPTLADREWVCEQCGVINERDVNA